MNILECGEDLPVVTIVNVSSTFSLNLQLNICKIAMTRKDIPGQVNKKEISTMRIQTESPITQRTANLIYENGRVIVTGACFEEMSRLCARSFVAMLHQKGLPVSMKGFSINNITGVIDMGFWINLPRAGSYMENLNCLVIYEPTQYPAMRLREVKGVKGGGRMSSLVYPNGKCIITGVKTRQALAEAVRWLAPHMSRFRQTGSGVETTEARYKQGVATDLQIAKLIDEIMATGDIPEYMFDSKIEMEPKKLGSGAKRGPRSDEPVENESEPRKIQKTTNERKEKGPAYVYVMPTDLVLNLSLKYDPAVINGEYTPLEKKTRQLIN